jgi:sulfur carrier protein ThiS
MRLFGGSRTQPIKVKLHVRAFVDGRMLRVAADVDAHLGDRLKDLLRHLRRAGTVDSSLVRQILHGNPGVMVLRNGERLAMPAAANQILADADEVSVLTPMAGG